MYIELAILVIMGDGEIIGGHFLSFYFFALSLMDPVEGKRKFCLKQEKSANDFPLVHSLNPFFISVLSKENYLMSSIDL